MEFTRLAQKGLGFGLPAELVFGHHARRFVRWDIPEAVVAQNVGARVKALDGFRVDLRAHERLLG